ncbi:hypothetical protein HS041_14750 [Planomonospora sp. ID67723]|uniref:hypothetical protein n=1 Tax=Planomonospora sp. ID67723 TaxID=2738134 RepID=UPI0018C446D0|nr:hypothetical protein [Planomonospora sp. ID67723]MBG0829029.1 hypothetical protein [Planomonospora sp. ID67723]
MIPKLQQTGTLDLDTWCVVPAESNPDRREHGAWAVAAGDSEEYDLYFEITDAEYPRQVAAFIVDAVQEHATRLRLNAAVDDVLRERERLLAIPHDAVALNRLAPFRLMALMSRLGQIAGQLENAGKPLESEERMVRVYGDVAQVAAVALAWMESIQAGHNVDA